MAKKSARKLFVNLAVRDLPRSQRFFTQLGFEFDPDGHHWEVFWMNPNVAAS